jgi:hypothetical protein
MWRVAGLLVPLVLDSGCVALVPDKDSALDVDATDGSVADVSSLGLADMTSPEAGRGFDDAPVDGGNVDEGASLCTPCAEQAFRCSASGVPQLCSNSLAGCAMWQDMPACKGTEICCDGACVPADESNCYACGQKCKGDSPVCDPANRRCGCSTEVCAARNQRCDDATGACVDLPGVTYWVGFPDTSSDGGALENHFKTITAALDAANRAQASDAGIAGTTHIIVAKGTYDRDHGETLPIVVRGGVWLEGQGSGQSIIIGAAYHTTPRPMLGNGLYLTMVVGDAGKLNQISGFTLQAGPWTFLDDPNGILCDRGNGVPADAALAPVPNTLLSDLVLSSDFGDGVIATSDAPYGGCNLRVTRSQILAKGVGIWADGCEPVVPSAASPVSIEVGDGTTTGGNTFQYQSPTSGRSVAIDSCVTRASIRNNTFSGMWKGIVINQPLRSPPIANHLIIDDNKFDRLTSAGLSLQGGLAVVEELKGNVFSQVSTLSAMGTGAAGVSLIGLDEDGFTRVVTARQNSFADNDVGLMIASSFSYKPSFPSTDFGRADDPGLNVFRCNSRPSPAVGGDVMVDLTPTGDVTFSLDGNSWDHVVPTQAALGSQPNGTDLSARDSALTHLLDANPTVDMTACAMGRIR